MMDQERLEEFERMVRDGHRVTFESDPYWYNDEHRSYPHQFHVVITENHDGDLTRSCRAYGRSIAQAWDRAYLLYGEACLSFKQHGVPAALAKRLHEDLTSI